MQRISFHINLVIIPHLIMINKVFYLKTKKIFIEFFILDQNPSKIDSTNVNDMVDIDERLKSLEKFMKENLPS